MSHLVSVITPVHLGDSSFLSDAYESLEKQEMPSGWEWRWIVQEDGHSGKIGAQLPENPRITFQAGRRGGPAIARTLALSRADGELIKVLDADDQLTSGALARDIAVLTNNPEIDWTTSRVLDLLPDGSTEGFEHDPSEGIIEPGSVLQHWRAHGFRAQVHPASLCVRRQTLLALGGWMALPASEDTGLLLALDAIAKGYFIVEPGLLYRKWAGQATAQDAHTDEAERLARMRVIEERARALA